ncbi:SDR family oxidoreductase [Rhizobium sp. Leaf321]|uniref:SDR family oxidoreductase n=1 Tax=Rhizobium sp. Leaf321 TaxID=1736335 RepID=UPI001FCCDAC2|nr:SDR family oxidoreductase [Rhizobium sp. Leaf321]
MIGSSAGDIGTKGYGVYGATTTDVRSFTRTWANGFAPKGIRVNVVSRGPNDTALMAAAPQEIRDALLRYDPARAHGPARRGCRRRPTGSVDQARRADRRRAD